ncbi:MAG TPA: hypothetical protein PLG78_11190, partial [Leptospiraceae bacterium]|nr:hypothetical protein [Leptospiraceae bacterium]
MRYYVVLMFLLISSALHAVEPDVFVGGKKILFAELKASEWKTLSLRDRRMMAPRLVDYGTFNATRRSEFVELLSAESDPYLRAHAIVARAFFRSADDRIVRDELQSQLSRADSISRPILEYYAAMLAKMPAANLSSLACKFSELDDSCRAIKLRVYIEQLALLPQVSVQQIRDLQSMAAPLLLKNPIKPAMYHRIAEGVPEKLSRLRLPLEAAIIQERMLRGIESAWANDLRARIPFYLATAGDFASALRYTENRASLRNIDLRMARLDWMILSGRYKQAVDSLTEIIEGNIDLSGLHGKDPWTGFTYSKEGLRLRLAMVLHLAGDSGRAARALEMLKDSKGKTDLGEPVALYSRIRLAQILLKDRPELAHKLAEDVTYEAQAQNWSQLEYYATILDGWALYYSKQYFPAVVNFTKAGGIVRDPPAEYSRLLGLMVSQMAMAPASPQIYSIQRLKTMLASRPYHRAIYTIRDWVPEDAGQDFFIEQSVLNFETRKDRWSSLLLLEEFKRLEEFYFHAGNNPGGARGLLTSDVWFRTLREFPSVRILSRGVLEDNADSLRASIQGLIQPQALFLADDSAYLFPFQVRDKVYTYLVAPAVPRSRAPRLILREDMSVADYFALADSCRRGPCKESFPELGKFAASFRILQVQWRTGDPDFQKLFRRQDLSVYLFYDGFLPPKQYKSTYHGAYKPACSTPGAPLD